MAIRKDKEIILRKRRRIKNIIRRKWNNKKLIRTI
jgi:hypothetical protein